VATASKKTTKKLKPKPDLTFELAYRRQGFVPAGVDEVGRGCLAGPVVTAAVVLPDLTDESPAWWWELNDSKLLTKEKREELSVLVWEHAKVHVAWATSEEIDQYNILRASLLAMRRALNGIAGSADAVLVDGHMNPFDPRYRCLGAPGDESGPFKKVEMLVKGDQRSLSIAAASVVAKVYRDKWMADLDRAFPGYGFSEHKGYSTPVHQESLKKLGPCGIHRMSFAPVKALWESRQLL
jgi:ribonuclease HII